MNVPEGILYLLDVAGKTLAQANHLIAELTEQNAELTRRVAELSVNPSREDPSNR